MTRNPVLPTRLVARGRGDHVPAVTADVETRTEPAPGVVAHEHTWMPEVEVTAAAPGLHHTTAGQRSVSGHEALKAAVATVLGVDVDDEETTGGAGPQTDVGSRPLGPPRLDLPGIRRRRFQPASDARVLGW